jgi:hypothetical protein
VRSTSQDIIPASKTMWDTPEKKPIFLDLLVSGVQT